MTVVPSRRLVLNVGRIDGNTTSLFLGSTINLGVVRECRAALGGQDFRNGRSESGLAVIDVAYRHIQPRSLSESEIQETMRTHQ